ncbi:uncharacterized protein LOC116617535 [Nematostella vectensis]|uniref:uncharacterized protein LOC116617535 n=1 Tax=Nematostella vectensis TaxID=45351 RepID=UPI0020774AA6|nr:uncharacterized protein LOC116617535 [Nematostella vectensis]
MMYKLAFCVFITVTVRLASGNQFVARNTMERRSAKSAGRFRKHVHTYLNVDGGARILVARQSACVLACLRNDTCFSLNLAAKADANRQFWCEILATDKYNMSHKLNEMNETSLHFSIGSPCYDGPCLHGGSCRASYHDDNYTCSCQRGYNGRNCENGLGSSQELPGLSCKQIRDQSFHRRRESGEYWLDPSGTQQPLRAFCDMQTDKGGWTLISQTEIKELPIIYSNLVWSSNYRDIAQYNHGMLLIEESGIQQLRDFIGFTQLRWRCHKLRVGRTIDIMTTNDSMGAAVVDHFLVRYAPPPACGSFVRLPGDNSTLTQNCAKWGKTSSSVEINRWGHYEYYGNKRMYERVCVWSGHLALNMSPATTNPLMCDDKENQLSIGDKWQLFVR